MPDLIWDDVGERYFETGVNRGVFYNSEGTGIVWNGLISVKENPSGGEATPYYLDGVKYLNVAGPEEFEGSIEAYTYPDEFSECDGTVFDEHGLGFGLQPRKPFGLSYQTMLGNDIKGLEYGYKIHLVYNALVSPSDKSNETVDDSLEAMTFNWNFTTRPEIIPNRRPTAHLIVNSTRTNQYLLAELERILYGSSDSVARLPSAAEMVSIFGWEMFRVVPEEVEGLAPLVTDGVPDLKGNIGLYTKTIDTRLTETAIPGLYHREN